MSPWELKREFLRHIEEGNVHEAEVFLIVAPEILRPCRNGYGETALILATKADRPGPMVRMLLKYKFDPNVVSREGQSPLQLATTLHISSKGEDEGGVIEMLLKAGADVNIRHPEVPLLKVVTRKLTWSRSPCPKIVRLLIEAGANPHVRNTNGDSAVSLAEHAEKRNRERKRLIRLNKEKDEESSYYFTPSIMEYDNALLEYHSIIRCYNNKIINTVLQAALEQKEDTKFGRFCKSDTFDPHILDIVLAYVDGKDITSKRAIVNIKKTWQENAKAQELARKQVEIKRLEQLSKNAKSWEDWDDEHWDDEP
jgi:hypothetical protein